MDHESFLLTVSELSIAVVGFSAIVAALIRNRGAEESPFQSLLIRAMVEFGFAALLFSLLPFLVSFFGATDPLGSRFSNTTIAVFYFSYFPIYQRRRAHAIAQSPGRTNAPAFYLRVVITYVIGLAALLGGWGLLPVSAFAAYALAISWLLFVAGYGFLMVIREVHG